MRAISYEPIGVIRTPFEERRNMPIQPAGAQGVKGSVEMRPEFEKAAQHRHVGAMHWLGRIYDGEEEVRSDLKQAIKWPTLASEWCDAQSQCSLGVHYMNGEGVRRNQKKAAVLYRAAAVQGDEWACYLLGLCYRDGQGVRRNRRWARHWFNKAASMKVREARKALARLDASD